MLRLLQAQGPRRRQTVWLWPRGCPTMGSSSQLKVGWAARDPLARFLTGLWCHEDAWKRESQGLWPLLPSGVRSADLAAILVRPASLVWSWSALHSPSCPLDLSCHHALVGWGKPGGAAGSLLPYGRRPRCPGRSSWSRWPTTYPLSVRTAVPTLHSVETEFQQ